MCNYFRAEIRHVVDRSKSYLFQSFWKMDLLASIKVIRTRITSACEPPQPIIANLDHEKRIMVPVLPRRFSYQQCRNRAASPTSSHITVYTAVSRLSSRTRLHAISSSRPRSMPDINSSFSKISMWDYSLKYAIHNAFQLYSSLSSSQRPLDN